MNLKIIFHLIFIFIAFSVYAEESLAPESEIKSYTLKEIWETALKNNFQIKQAKEQIKQQHGLKVQARAEFLPSLSIISSVDQTDQNRIPNFGGNTFGDDVYWVSDAELSQKIYAGGKNKALFNQQNILLQSTVHAFDAVVNDQLLRINERYYAVLLAKEQIEVQRKLLELSEKELVQEKKKLQAGTVSEFNVIRTEVNVANNKVPFIRAKNNYRIAQAELLEAMGVTSDIAAGGEQLKIIGEFEYEPFDLKLNEARDLAQKDRPEIKQYKLLVEASKQGVRAAEAGFYPELSIFGAYGFEKNRFESSFDESLEGWKAGARGNWNLFNGFKTKGQIETAKAESQIALHQKAEVSLNIDIETRRAFSSFVEAKELLDASKKSVEQAEESLRLAESRFDNGISTQLDLFQTQVALTQARTNEVQSLHDYLVAISRLKKSTGTLFPN